ncbi:MAG: PIN domain-containing protein [Methanomicrobiales archaeon]|nr:PIN domain-containing protein [Methanomicrobiales archaeon]
MILVDSSVFIGLADRKDQWHENALGLLPRLKEERIVISDLIIAEVLTIIGRRSGGKVAKDLYCFFMDSCEVYPLDRDARGGAVDLFIRFDGTLSLSDSLSLWIMEQKGISSIYSFDADFDRVRSITRVY